MPASRPVAVPAPVITHGEQITAGMVGPSAASVTAFTAAGTSMQNGSGDYEITTTRPSWPGIRTVAAAGELIDGVQVPGGAWVAQGLEFTGGVIVVGGAGFPGLVLRACRVRANTAATPSVRQVADSGGHLIVSYCDLGGATAAVGSPHEVAVKSDGGAVGNVVIQRCNITLATTGIQFAAPGTIIRENRITDLVLFSGGGPGGYHLNGITTNGGLVACYIARNNVTLPSPDLNGTTISQTDCISFFQDFGEFSQGPYRVRDNYVGGGAYPFYSGKNAGSGATSVQGMQVTGNKVTTTWWSSGGANGVDGAPPVWGSLGNVWEANTWADGASAGQAIPAP